MKKMLTLMLALAICLSMTACGSSSDTPSDETTDGAGATSDTGDAAGQAAEDEEQPEATNTETPDADSEEDPAVEEPADVSEPAYEVGYSNVEVWTDSIDTTWAQTVVAIQNTGDTNLYLNSSAYDLEAEDGTLVAAQSYVSCFPDVLAPGETGYMYEETTIDNYSGDGALTVIPHLDVENSSVEPVRYEVTDLTVSDDEYLGVSVMGRVANTTDTDGEMVYVTVVLLDANGDPLGLMFTIIDSLAAGDQQGFEATAMSMPDSVNADAVASTEVYAYPYQPNF